MRHAGTQELETDRLFLRRLLPEDADMMYANWASDPQVTRFLRWEPHKNALETLGLLAAWATLYPNPDYYQWAIVEKASGQVFGSIGIFNAGLEMPVKKHSGRSWTPRAASGKQATASDGAGGTEVLPPKR